MDIVNLTFIGDEKNSFVFFRVSFWLDFSFEAICFFQFLVWSFLWVYWGKHLPVFCVMLGELQGCILVFFLCQLGRTENTADHVWAPGVFHSNPFLAFFPGLWQSPPMHVWFPPQLEMPGSWGNFGSLHHGSAHDQKTLSTMELPCLIKYALLL